MVHSLILSYLSPQIVFQRQVVSYLKKLVKAPTIAELTHVIQQTNSGKIKSADLFQALVQARNQATLLQKRLEKDQTLSHIHFWSKHYPEKLRVIDYPPWNLFCYGKLPMTSRKTLSIIGSRKPNSYGHEVLHSILPQLDTNALQVVSGLAYGIDSLAHEVSCSLSIPNFAILGSGLDYIYPHSKKELLQKILRVDGGVATEYPPDVSAKPYYFPWRNRIISGLCDVLWVIQGTLKSGSLHTVQHALQQNKQIAATPGDIFSELEALPNQLITEGAIVVLSASDINQLLSSS